MTSPPDHAMPGQSKRRRIDEIDAATGGEGLIELEVLSIHGECILTLNVAESKLGRELWMTILDKLPSRPGLQLVVSHTSRLLLNERLQQQGLGSQRAQVWATYMPVNLLAAWRFAHGASLEDEEFSLNGITEVTGVDGATSEILLRNLPTSLQSIWRWIRWGTSSCEITSRPSKFDFWWEFRSEPGQCDMASRP